MCGLCSARCNAEEAKYNIAILDRRHYGRHVLKKAEHLQERVQQIEQGRFDDMLNQIMKVDINTLKKLYAERQTEPDNVDEM